MSLDPSTRIYFTRLTHHYQLPFGLYLGTIEKISGVAKISISSNLEEITPQSYPSLSEGQYLVGCLRISHHIHVYAVFNGKQMNALLSLSKEWNIDETYFRILEITELGKLRLGIESKL